METKPQLSDATPMANSLTALAAMLTRPGDKATLHNAAQLILHLHALCLADPMAEDIEQLARKINASGLTVADSKLIAMLCHNCAVLCEAESPHVAILLASASDLLTRQQLMLEQAKQLPRPEYAGRAH